ncbi:hypothetical protein ABIE67_005163 [Streptomyces sp. V4I8]|uniref:hypothetical protein n=1 Tax=Streptomyces sp. V4I8 TaxID=3156469 RepID=UPI003511A201
MSRFAMQACGPTSAIELDDADGRRVAVLTRFGVVGEDVHAAWEHLAALLSDAWVVSFVSFVSFRMAASLTASSGTGPSPRGDRCRTAGRSRSVPSRVGGSVRIELDRGGAESGWLFGTEVLRKVSENMRRHEWSLRALGWWPAWVTR